METSPSDVLSEENFWQTETDIVSGINACYAAALDNSSSGFGLVQWRTENVTPNAYNQSGETQIAEGSHNAGNFDYFENKFNTNYGGIGRVNNLLAHIDGVNMNAGLKQRIRGEALFLRALFYSDLAFYYGDVPLITEAPSLDQATLPRDPKEDVITQVLADLNEAASLLPMPGSYGGSDIGRATKGAALALKARVLLYESRWAEAAASAKEVIDMQAYSLFPDYRRLFMQENENNEEVVFDFQYMIGENEQAFNRIIENQLNMAPVKGLVDSYLMKDGLSIDESPLFDPDNPYDNRDPRLLQSIAVPGKMFRGQIIAEDRYVATGYSFKKLTDYEDDVVTPNIHPSGLNFIVLRYADVLLMYAEAKNEASGPDNSVYNALNEIRDRVDMPDIPTGLTQNEMRDVIRHERRIELAGEGLYYRDILRWRIAEIVNNAPIYNIRGEVLQYRTFNPVRDYLWPIHSNTIQENPALSQNPGF